MGIGSSTAANASLAKSDSGLFSASPNNTCAAMDDEAVVGERGREKSILSPRTSDRIGPSIAWLLLPYRVFPYKGEGLNSIASLKSWFCLLCFSSFSHNCCSEKFGADIFDCWIIMMMVREEMKYFCFSAAGWESERWWRKKATMDRPRSPSVSRADGPVTHPRTVLTNWTWTCVLGPSTYVTVRTRKNSWLEAKPLMLRELYFGFCNYL